MAKSLPPITLLFLFSSLPFVMAVGPSVAATNYQANVYVARVLIPTSAVSSSNSNTGQCGGTSPQNGGLVQFMNIGNGSTSLISIAITFGGETRVIGLDSGCTLNSGGGTVNVFVLLNGNGAINGQAFSGSGRLSNGASASFSGEFGVSSVNTISTTTSASTTSSTTNSASTNAYTFAGTIGPVTFSSSTTLDSDVYCTNLTIQPGVTVTTNGHNFYCSGTFNNQGTIDTGVQSNGGTPGATGCCGPGGMGGGGGYGLYVQANAIMAGTIHAPGGAGASCSSQYCGGGGGGGGGVLLLAYGAGGYVPGTYNLAGGLPGSGIISENAGQTRSAGNGGSTIAAGGVGALCNGPSSPGLTPSPPSLSVSLIQTWFSGGFSNYLNGAGGGGGSGAGPTPGGAGGSVPNSYAGSGGGGESQCDVGSQGGAGQALSYDYGVNPPVSVSGTTTSTTGLLIPVTGSVETLTETGNSWSYTNGNICGDPSCLLTTLTVTPTPDFSAPSGGFTIETQGYETDPCN